MMRAVLRLALTLVYAWKRIGQPNMPAPITQCKETDKGDLP